MPLPENGADWPPKRIQPAFELMNLHDAWHVGDPMGLTATYQGQKWMNHKTQFAGGVVGFAARLWWGKPQPNGEARVKLHLPLPADISTMSADLLFSEPPRIVIPNASKRNADGTVVESEQQRQVEEIVNTPATHTKLLMAAEVASALGGGYLRLVWDRNSMDHVAIDVVDADAAIPTFRFGVLHEVMFFTAVSVGDDEKYVLRHCELVERGRITHALYRGDRDRLGKRVPLSESEETSWLAALRPDEVGGTVTVDEGALTVSLTTGVEGLTACYVPNILPNREFRKDPYLSQFGRSDYAGIEPTFDAIDEAYSSWERDIRLGKARIIVPSSYLEHNGPGQGSYMDTEREVYEAMDFLATDPGARAMTPQQFAIRVAEHEQTITEWTRYALRAAGFSPGSLGENDTGARTATEINAQERLTARTRDKKTNYWKAALRTFVKTWLDLENVVYSGPRLTEAPEIRFPAESQQDEEELARIAQLLASSSSASVMTRVRRLNPDWEGQTVNEEVERIYREQGIGAIEPDAASYRGIVDTEQFARNVSKPMSDEEAEYMAERAQARVAQAAQEAEEAQ